MDEPHIVTVSNLTKRFGRVVALDGISFSIAKGEIVGFLGPNGAGKTTMMRILSCFLPPTSGSVTVGGFDVISGSMDIRRIIGYMPENVPLYPEMRVSDYVSFRGRIKGLKGSALKHRVRETMEMCGLSDVARFVIGRLSKGYRQRVGLADSLVNEPDLLILDEPTIGLDPNQIRHVREMIRGLAGRHTILLSTHILSEVEMICDRVLIMDKGGIVASDKPCNLIGLLVGNAFFEAEIRGPLEEIKRKCGELPGVFGVEVEDGGEWHKVIVECGGGTDPREGLFTLSTTSGWSMRDLRSGRRRNLEDVFVELTEGGGKR